MRVDGNISDLFFNTVHETDNDGEYNNLEGDAQDFLDCLESLGVSAPTVEELVADFYTRI